MTVKQRIWFDAAEVGDLLELKDITTGETRRTWVADRVREEQRFGNTTFSGAVVLISEDGRRWSGIRATLPSETGPRPYTDANEPWLLLADETDLLRWSITRVREGADPLGGAPAGPRVL